MNADTFIFVSRVLAIKREIFTKKLVVELKVFHIKMPLRCIIAVISILNAGNRNFNSAWEGPQIPFFSL